MSKTPQNRCPYCFVPISPDAKACSPEHEAKLRRPAPDPLLSRAEVAAILKRARGRGGAA